MTRALLVAAVALGLGAAGCRPDAGPNNYGNQESFPDGGTTSLPGPDPYVPGTPRLNLGAFYEGGSSQTIIIDNTTTHLYVYQVGTGADQFPGTDDRWQFEYSSQTGSSAPTGRRQRTRRWP